MVYELIGWTFSFTWSILHFITLPLVWRLATLKSEKYGLAVFITVDYHMKKDSTIQTSQAIPGEQIIRYSIQQICQLFLIINASPASYVFTACAHCNTCTYIISASTKNLCILCKLCKFICQQPMLALQWYKLVFSTNLP